MRKIVFLLLFTVLFCTAPALAGDVSMSASDIEPMLVRGDLQHALKTKQRAQVLYLTKYQIVYVTIKNGSNKPINVNPGYFTLASSAKKSYSFTSEMYGLKHKLPWLGMKPIQAGKVLPGTTAEGYLMFERSEKKRVPGVALLREPGDERDHTNRARPKGRIQVITKSDRQ